MDKETMFENISNQGQALGIQYLLIEILIEMSKRKEKLSFTEIEDIANKLIKD